MKAPAASNAEPSAVLGIVEMANRPLRHPGNLGNSHTFDYPVAYARAPSAFVARVLARDERVADDYVEQGLELQARGARAILTTCGFNVAYQSQIAARLDVPVGTSSLLLLPLLLKLISPMKAVGVITFDRQQLGAELLTFSGLAIADQQRLRIVGLEGTRSWQELRRPEPDLPLDVIADDLMRRVQQLLGESAAMGAILLECSAFCPFSPRIRQETGLPVFDFLCLADLIRAGAADFRPFGERGRQRKPDITSACAAGADTGAIR